MTDTSFPGWHGTTIIGVKKGDEVVIAGDGQVSLGQTVIKGTARKVRRVVLKWLPDLRALLPMLLPYWNV
jgi:hypothetical protein